MIVSCPSCGTHYRHRAQALPIHARCGRCDAAVDRTALRPYRIVAGGATVAAGPPPVRSRAAMPAIGLDEPRLAAAIEANRTHSGAEPGEAAWTWRVEADDDLPELSSWEELEPLEPNPEAAHAPAFEPSVPPVSEDEVAADRAGSDLESAEPIPAPRARPAGLGAAATWGVAGAVLGTGVSWSSGGTTGMGVLVGSLCGLTAAWGWLRWTSRP